MSQDAIERAISMQIKKYTYKEVKSFTNDFIVILGHGAYGFVYKGCINNMDIAVKKYNKGAEGPLLREICSLLNFKHPNIVPIYGICYEEEICLIFEYMSKGSLQDYINQKGGCIELDEMRVLEVLIELSEALEYFHSQNLYHRDIKPGNILFDSYGKPMFADFNHSVFYDNNESGKTNSLLPGTVVYSDPTLKEDNQVGYFVDMYSFGIMMLVVLSETEEEKIVGIHGRAKKIVDSKDVLDMKHFFKKDWDYDIGMRLLSCCMDCTKSNRTDRLKAKELSEILRNYKIKYIKLKKSKNETLEILNEEALREYKDLKEKYEAVCIEKGELEERIKIQEIDIKEKNDMADSNQKEIGRLESENREKQKLNENYKQDNIQKQKTITQQNSEIAKMSDLISEKNSEITKMSDLISEKNSEIQNLKYEISCLKEKFKDEPSSSEEPLNESAVNSLQSSQESCFIMELNNLACHFKLLNLLQDTKETIYNPLENDVYKIVKKMPSEDNSKCRYKVSDTKKIMEKINSIFKLCSKIIFFNIDTWSITEDITIKNDIVIESNTQILINIQNIHHIKIKGDIKVELNSFRVICQKNDVMENFIKICNKAKLVIKNGIFQENIGLAPLIRVTEACGLEIHDTVFNGNLISNEYSDRSTCIETLSGSDLKIENCSFNNHLTSNPSYEDSCCIISAEGNTTIINCNFENNQNNNLRSRLIAFKGNSSNIEIVNSSFSKCVGIIFSGNVRAKLHDCKFNNNTQTNFTGGAIFATENAKIEMHECNFAYNKAFYGGTISCSNNSNLYMKLCSFNENQATDGNGGALYLDGNSVVEMNACSFYRNKAALKFGGAIYLTRDSKAKIVSCIFYDNYCSNEIGCNIYCSFESNILDLQDNQFIDYDLEVPQNIYFES